MPVLTLKRIKACENMVRYSDLSLNERTMIQKNYAAIYPTANLEILVSILENIDPLTDFNSISNERYICNKTVSRQVLEKWVNAHWIDNHECVIDQSIKFGIGVGYNRTCCYCDIQLFEHNHTIDHIIASSIGGNNTHWNKTPCCFDCNKDKGNKTLEQWAAHIEKSRKGLYRIFNIRKMIDYRNQNQKKMTRHTLAL